jgi:hypothetical protein
MRRGDSVELEGKDDRDRICCSSQVQLRTERELDVIYSAWWRLWGRLILAASWHS